MANDAQARVQRELVVLRLLVWVASLLLLVLVQYSRLLLDQLFLGAACIRWNVHDTRLALNMLLQRCEVLVQEDVDDLPLLVLDGRVRELLHEQVDKLLISVQLLLYLLAVLVHLDDLRLELLDVVVLIFHYRLELVQMLNFHDDRTCDLFVRIQQVLLIVYFALATRM